MVRILISISFISDSNSHDHNILAHKNVNSDFKSSEIDMNKMKRHSNESDYKFLRRVNRITHQRRLEADFAAKYNVDIQRNQETGEIKLKKRKRSEVDEIDALMNKKREQSKNGKKKFVEADDEDTKVDQPAKLTSLQKMKLKKLEKKMEKQKEKDIEFAEYQHEEIKFGERVEAPPSLSIPRKATKVEGVQRPGKRSLLLTGMIDKEKADEFAEIEAKKPPPPRVIYGRVDKKGKRKNLPNATRTALETERKNAVEMYRLSKKKGNAFRHFTMPKKNLDDFE